jgi:hypothetical protein
MSGWPPADFARSHFTARLSNIDLSISAFREVRWKAHRFKPSSADWVALVNPNSNAVQTVFQLDTSGGSFEQIFQTRIQCCVKIGHSTVIQATDGNLWVTDPNAQPWGTVYTITPTGTLILATRPTYFTKTAVGSEATPLVTTSNRLGPFSWLVGTSKCAATGSSFATAILLKSCVRL